MTQLQNSHNYLDWLEFINNLLKPAQGLSSEDEVVYPQQDFFQAFFNLLQRTSKRTLANYIMWRVVEDNLAYLTEEIKEAKKVYLCSIGKKERDEGDHDTFCLVELEQRSDSSLPSLGG